ncbi:MAG: ParB/RepB/Spo0J family partition protein [Clostridia bacterium]|nr:ParB/RepB/Spo0J family partition protein [Oscillospiraceae bacterium]MBO4933378.1 ParB/RepB/Spo0J family partition protein [Clostridia bacterium]MBO5127977.1 ParB/RepB/Spo0J family partition protein [Clostridia bacterium]MBP3293173.1 ParB/RepB/Spo0J family partition protein [Clostridia bacterium]MBQ7312154.1 ParB/RepB/Spo0J family partition protein [Clostridia bacterium]
MAKNKGLGRGLDAIFLDNAVDNDGEAKNGVLSVSISQIDPKIDQPRRTFDSESLAGLADSISANGVLQPILVRKVDDRYEIIAGERRFRASKLAGLSEIPVIVLEADDLAAAKFALIENLQREDLNPYEEARAYSMLMKEYRLSQEEISLQIGKSRSAIANSLRLLDLPDEIVRMLVEGLLTAGHGRALLGLRDKSQMVPLAERCVNRNLSVRDVEAAVKAANKLYGQEQQETEAEEVGVQVDYIHSLETRFTNFTGRRCKISAAKNKKMFQLEYRDNEDLEELLKKLAGAGIFDDY